MPTKRKTGQLHSMIMLRMDKTLRWMKMYPRMNNKKMKKRRTKKQKEAEESQKIISTKFLPGSMKKLRACHHCKLVLDRKRWIDLGKCPNCPSSGGLSETTDEFQNVIGQIYPKMSWVA